VTVSDFELGIHEVTNEQYCVFLNTMGNQVEDEVTWVDLASEYCLIEKVPGGFAPKADFEQHPVLEVSWYGAMAYCKWLSELTGQGYGLPTEAEWEYAAGGGSGKRTIWSGTSTEGKVGGYGNFMRGDPYKETSPVGSFEPNSLGLFDMSGNVREWCFDYYSNSYYGTTPGAVNPRGPESGKARANRGGSYGSDVKALRIANRDAGTANVRKYYIGFRVAKDVK
jgi:formylglycine-generating enzyme